MAVLILALLLSILSRVNYVPNAYTIRRAADLIVNYLWIIRLEMRGYFVLARMSDLVIVIRRSS